MVMVGSIFLYAFAGQENDEEEDLPENAITVGEYTFYETREGHYGIFLETNTGVDIPVLFRLDPRAAGDIHLDNQSVDIIKASQKLYFTYDPNQENMMRMAPKLKVAMAQLSRMVPLVAPNVIPVAAQTADIPNSTDDDFIPIKNCVDTTTTTTVVLFEIADKNQIVFEDNCVKLQAINEDALINVSDKLGMNLVNINV